MHRCRLPYAPQVSARAIDGSLIYRGYEVKVLLSAHLTQEQYGKEAGTDG